MASFDPKPQTPPRRLLSRCFTTMLIVQFPVTSEALVGFPPLDTNTPRVLRVTCSTGVILSRWGIGFSLSLWITSYGGRCSLLGAITALAGIFSGAEGRTCLRGWCIVYNCIIILSYKGYICDPESCSVLRLWGGVGVVLHIAIW